MHKCHTHAAKQTLQTHIFAQTQQTHTLKHKTHSNTNACRHTNTNIHTQKHTQPQTHTDTYTQTQTQIQLCTQKQRSHKPRGRRHFSASQSSLLFPEFPSSSESTTPTALFSRFTSFVARAFTFFSPAFLSSFFSWPDQPKKNIFVNGHSTDHSSVRANCHPTAHQAKATIYFTAIQSHFAMGQKQKLVVRDGGGP